jgi:hypothetical protein
MKQFAVELRRTSYVTVYVDAETKEQAEDKVWNEAEYAAYDDGDADWECSDIYEQFATDESRNIGVTA